MALVSDSFHDIGHRTEAPTLIVEASMSKYKFGFRLHNSKQSTSKVCQSESLYYFYTVHCRRRAAGSGLVDRSRLSR
jgi:hypothetical protein